MPSDVPREWLFNNEFILPCIKWSSILERRIRYICRSTSCRMSVRQ